MHIASLKNPCILSRLLVFINDWQKLVIGLMDFLEARYYGSNERNNNQNFLKIFVFHS